MFRETYFFSFAAKGCRHMTLVCVQLSHFAFVGCNNFAAFVLQATKSILGFREVVKATSELSLIAVLSS